MAEHPTERTPREARQAEKGRPVLAVLVASIVLAVVVFAALSWLQPADVEPVSNASGQMETDNG